MAGAVDISELMLRWDELREQGQPIGAEELCRDCPELVEEARRQIQALEAMYRVPNGASPDAPTLTAVPEQVFSPSEHPQVAGYEILAELGRGGMGVVYQARQVSLNRVVALKMILSGEHASARDRRRFRVEAEAVAQLQHPNIVQIHEVGEQNGRPYLALEFVNGGSLAQRLSGGPLPAREAAHIARELAQAADYAHQRGIIHRDLKPANILLQGSSHGSTRISTDQKPEDAHSSIRVHPCSSVAKISDFGLAKRLDAETGPTRTGTVLGTPNYMAPEQAEGRTRDIGPATDVYALGAILYEMLTGRPPFQAATLLATLEQVRCQEPLPPTSLRRDLPRDLETICLKCLQKDPRQRYASASDLAEDLRRFLDGELISARSFTLVDRLARTLNRSENLAAFRSWANVLMVLAPVPFLLHVLVMVVTGGGPAFPLAAMTTTLTLSSIMLVIFLRLTWSPALWSVNSPELHLWSIRIGHLVGMAVIPIILWQFADADHPWNPLMVYPFWSVLTGLTFFSVASRYWGRYYLVGLAFFLLAFVMPARLEWAPVEFGLLFSVIVINSSLHLRRFKDEKESPPNHDPQSTSEAPVGNQRSAQL
jgi:serine/threonine protein kinase